MDRFEPPPTKEGWFVLHDFRVVDWGTWREATENDRERILEEGRVYLAEAEDVADADEGASATYAINGHKADLLLIHLRPTLDELNVLERRLEATALGAVTDRVHSYVSVTEVSGYTTSEGFDDGGFDQIDDQGLRNYLETRLYPSVPDADYVCFYPMSKRRDPEYNWYELPFEDRAAHIERHGEIGRQYAGRVTQMITGSIGFDDWEWGITLWADDPTAFKSLLYEMRFDPSTARFAEFGPFYTGERLPPDRLGAYLRGERLRGTDRQGPPSEPDDGAASTRTSVAEDLRAELADLGIYGGQPHGEDVFALVLYSDADPRALAEEVQGLRGNFDHYDTHENTAVYRAEEGEQTAVVSVWGTEEAAETAAGFLSELPGVVDRGDDRDGFSTMGMFYRVKPAARGDFVDTFRDIEAELSGMAGHRDTTLLTNLNDETDMFIVSRWRDKEDAMAFFRSDEFRETVSWGREILTERPRHVFLA